MQRARCYLLGETAVVLELEAASHAGQPETYLATGAASGGYAECRGSDTGYEQYHGNFKGTAIAGSGCD